jgi:hypothetical protein
MPLELVKSSEPGPSGHALPLIPFEGPPRLGPPDPCITCGALRRDHLTAGHAFVPVSMATCWSCQIRPALYKDEKNFLICASCAPTKPLDIPGWVMA